MVRLASVLSPDKWRKLINGQIELRRRYAGDDALDAVWAELGPVKLQPGAERILMADGLWFNPGYFLRLRLFIEAMAARVPVRLLGILRNRKDRRTRRALERIGFSEFIYIEDDEEFPIASFMAEAERLMAPAKTHADLIDIQLPEGVPAYVWYDTVLAKTSHGQTPLSHPEWKHSLAEMLAYIAIYRRTLETENIGYIALSHGWKSDWGSVLWLALQRGISSFCVTHYSEAIRLRRFRKPSDFDLPVEHLPRHVFEKLSSGEQARLVNFGQVELERRQTNQSIDINIRHAYALEMRVSDRAGARSAIGGGDRPIGVIYGHSWFDFPHVYHMRNFNDFNDWFETTVDVIRGVTDVDWFLKPHPMETWYGGRTMADMIGELPAHIKVLPHHIDTLTVMAAADAIVTVHGTAALEAGAMGIPVIAADNSYYADWDFANTARSRDHYRELLGRVGSLKVPDEATKARALACFVTTFGEPHVSCGALALPCDSGGAQLFKDIARIVSSSPEALAAESARISSFLAQDEIDSFESWSFVTAARSPERGLKGKNQAMDGSSGADSCEPLDRASGTHEASSQEIREI